MVVAKKVEAVMNASQLAVRLEKRWVTRDSLVQQISCLQQIHFGATAKARQKKILGARVQIERSDVTCWRTLDRVLFPWRKLDLELVGDLAQIARDSAFVMHHRGAADYFQVRDLGQVGQDFILHPVCEISVLFRLAQILEWKNGDALLGNGSQRASSSCPGKRRFGRRRWRSVEKDQRTNNQGNCRHNQSNYKRDPGRTGSTNWMDRGRLLTSFPAPELLRDFGIAKIIFVEVKEV